MVAKYDDYKLKQLLKNNGIVRNKLKIKSAINNAKIFLKIQKEYGSFDKYIWGFVNYKPIINQFTNANKYPVTTNISDEILDLLETFTANGSAVLMSTHNFPLIKPRNKKFIELSKGRMV